MPLPQEQALWEATGRWEGFRVVPYSPLPTAVVNFCTLSDCQPVVTDYARNQINSGNSYLFVISSSTPNFAMKFALALV